MGARPGGARPRPQKASLLLQFPGVARPVRLIDAAEVLEGLRGAIFGWEPAVSADSEQAAPMTTVERMEDGFRLSSEYVETPLDRLPAASAVCGVIADLSQAFFTERSGCLALHCGAFTILGRLVAMTGAARAGKSTMIARLTAEPDIAVLCDDVLPILDDGPAFGLGFAPRLRLPLPRSSSVVFRDHVAAHARLRDDRYAYVTAPTVAPHGTRAPLSVLVVLDRRASGPARLHRLESAEAVHHLLAQNMAGAGGDHDTFDRVTRLAQSVLCLKLVYADLEEAVVLVRSALGGTQLPDCSVDISAPLPCVVEPGPDSAPPGDLSRCWSRNPDAAIRRYGDDGFLWHSRTRGHFHVNAVAAAIWALLEDPQTGHELAATLASVFPNETPARISRDVAALLGALQAEDLIDARRPGRT